MIYSKLSKSEDLPENSVEAEIDDINNIPDTSILNTKEKVDGSNSNSTSPNNQSNKRSTNQPIQVSCSGSRQSMVYATDLYGDVVKINSVSKEINVVLGNI